jgi:hypothetical protein
MARSLALVVNAMPFDVSKEPAVRPAMLRKKAFRVIIFADFVDKLLETSILMQRLKNFICLLPLIRSLNTLLTYVFFLHISEKNARFLSGFTHSQRFFKKNLSI